MKYFIPNRTEDDCIKLPAGIDFTRPGQPDPWRVKEFRGQGNLSDMLGNLGGLAAQAALQGFTQNPHVNGQAQQQVPSHYLGLLGLGSGR